MPCKSTFAAGIIRSIVNVTKSALGFGFSDDAIEVFGYNISALGRSYARRHKFKQLPSAIALIHTPQRIAHYLAGIGVSARIDLILNKPL